MIAPVELKTPQDFALFWTIEELLRAQVHPIFAVGKSLESILNGTTLESTPELMIDAKQFGDKTPQVQTFRGFHEDLAIVGNAAKFICKKTDVLNSPTMNVLVRIYLVDTQKYSCLQFPIQENCGPSSLDCVVHIQNPVSDWQKIEKEVLHG